MTTKNNNATKAKVSVGALCVLAGSVGGKLSAPKNIAQKRAMNELVRKGVIDKEYNIIHMNVTIMG